MHFLGGSLYSRNGMTVFSNCDVPWNWKLAQDFILFTFADSVFFLRFLWGTHCPFLTCWKQSVVTTPEEIIKAYFNNMMSSLWCYSSLLQRYTVYNFLFKYTDILRFGFFWCFSLTPVCFYHSLSSFSAEWLPPPEGHGPRCRLWALPHQPVQSGTLSK